MRLNLQQFEKEVNFENDFAIIGMGQSKSEYIFDKEIITICINKSHLLYKGKPNYISTVYDHEKEILSLVPSEIPFVIIEKSDFKKYRLSLGGPICSMLYFISKRIKDNHKIYLLGNEMSDERDWEPYIKSFYECWLDNLQYRKKVKVVMLDGNSKLEFFK